MKFRALALAIAAIVVAPDAHGQNYDPSTGSCYRNQAYRDTWTDRVVIRREATACVQRREYYEPRYGYDRRREREYGYAPSGRGRTPNDCMPKIVEAVGFEYANVDKALKSAQIIYSASVRQEYGEIYQSVENATEVKVLCHDASVNDTAIGKLGEALIGDAAVLKRCKIWARPCRSQIEPTTFADPKSERGQIEEEKLERRGYVAQRQPSRIERWRSRFRRPVRQ